MFIYITIFVSIILVGIFIYLFFIKDTNKKTVDKESEKSSSILNEENVENAENETSINYDSSDIKFYYKYPVYDSTSTYLEPGIIKTVPRILQKNGFGRTMDTYDIKLLTNKSGNWITLANPPNPPPDNYLEFLELYSVRFDKMYTSIKYDGIIDNNHKFSVYLLSEDYIIIGGKLRIFLNKMFKYESNTITYPIVYNSESSPTFTLIKSDTSSIEDYIMFNFNYFSITRDIYDNMGKYTKLLDFTVSIKEGYTYNPDKYYQITTGIEYMDIASIPFNGEFPDGYYFPDLVESYLGKIEIYSTSEFKYMQYENKDIIENDDNGTITYTKSEKDNVMISPNITPINL